MKASSISVLKYDHPFNFSALNNYAVDNTNADLVLFLNNDTKVLTEGWIRKMVGGIVQKNVGAVGAKLLYPDRTIQHSGMQHSLEFRSQSMSNSLQEARHISPFSVLI